MKKALRLASAIILSFIFIPLMALAPFEPFEERGAVFVLAAVLTPVFCYFTLGFPLAWALDRLAGRIERKLSGLSASAFVVGFAGTLCGVLLASLVIRCLPLGFRFGGAVSALLLTVLGAAGCRLAVGKLGSIKIPRLSAASEPVEAPNAPNKGCRPKILDTSVIIDGRILDILRLGFIEGAVIIPSFVLEELRHIADSADALKRNRGRLGLDVLNRMKELENATVDIAEWSLPPGSGYLEVDMLLLKMAQDIGGCVITNDLSLNKIAELHKVPALNINELSNAVKTVVLPGQELTVFVVKEGKERNQGVAYLNDGTMIVIEDGRQFIETNLDIIVTSVLQTPAGRMVFGKYKNDMDT